MYIHDTDMEPLSPELPAAPGAAGPGAAAAGPGTPRRPGRARPPGLGAGWEPFVWNGGSKSDEENRKNGRKNGAHIHEKDRSGTR